MRKRFSILLVILLVAIAGVLLWDYQKPREPEPIFQGKPLSEWLNDYCILSGDENAIDKQNQAVDKVVRQIGTNAIPTLLLMFEETDSPFQRLVIWDRTHGLYLNHKFDSAPAFAKHDYAALAFRALGAEAKDAVPRLIDLYGKRSHENSKEMVAFALGGIGPSASAAVPSLLWEVTNHASHENSLRALGEIHAMPEKVVPVMIRLLGDSDTNVRRWSIQNLQAFGTDSHPAIPALVELLNDKDETVRKNAAEALKSIDPDAAAKAGVK